MQSGNKEDSYDISTVLVGNKPLVITRNTEDKKGANGIY